MTNPDHRIRVAAEKRERMRLRLIESALRVFAGKGADAAAIEDVILTADVSRGTFYNYFKTHDELFCAVLEAVGNEVLRLVDVMAAVHRDPAARVASGFRLVLHTTRRFPMFARFVARVGLRQTLRSSLAIDLLTRDLQDGIDAGQFCVPDVRVGLVLTLGGAQSAIVALTRDEPLPADFAERVTYHLLLGLGLGRRAAARAVDLPLQAVEFPADSLLARTRQCDDPLTH